MATIVCKQCPKTFKTETGFAWHHAHQHDLAQANDGVDPKIAWLKLQSLVEGAGLASEELA